MNSVVKTTPASLELLQTKDGLQDSEQLSTTTIIIIVVVVLVCLAALAGLLYMMHKRRKKDENHVDATDDPGLRLSLLGKQYKIPSLLNLHGSRKSSLVSTGFHEKALLNSDPELCISGRLALKVSNGEQSKGLFTRSNSSVVDCHEGENSRIALPIVEEGDRSSTYFYDEDHPRADSRKSSRSSQNLSMTRVAALSAEEVKIHMAPLASTETLMTSKSRPISYAHPESNQEGKFPQRSRPNSVGTLDDEMMPSLPPKMKATRRNAHSSTGVLATTSGVARKIALAKSKDTGAVTSQSDSDLVTRKRSPFADSDDEDDDFVDIAKLPPLPAKTQSRPRLFPKQKINKSRSDLEKINQEILTKLKSTTSLAAPDHEDYEEVPEKKRPSEEAAVASGVQEDYDEPIPHSSLIS